MDLKHFDPEFVREPVPRTFLSLLEILFVV